MRLTESEVSVDAKGYAYDDEGNRWFVGNRWPQGLYHGREAQEIAMASRGGGRRSTGSSSAEKQLDALAKAKKMRPRNRFLASVYNRIARDGRKLTSKQKSIVRDILTQLGGTESAKLFESTTTSSLLESIELQWR